MLVTKIYQIEKLSQNLLQSCQESKWYFSKKLSVVCMLEFEAHDSTETKDLC